MQTNPSSSNTPNSNDTDNLLKTLDGTLQGVAQCIRDATDPVNTCLRLLIEAVNGQEQQAGEIEDLTRDLDLYKRKCVQQAKLVDFAVRENATIRRLVSDALGPIGVQATDILQTHDVTHAHQIASDLIDHVDTLLTRVEEE